MRIFSSIFLLSILFSLLSCGSNHDDKLNKFQQLKASGADSYKIAYNYSIYLSTSTSITPEEAIPLINELISLGYPAAARYCIDNMERNGIHSPDLLALHGLCYQRELQPVLAEADYNEALRRDPGNAKIITLMNNLLNASEGIRGQHDILFQKGLNALHQGHYDSAYQQISRARELTDMPEYSPYITQLERIRTGESMIAENPDQVQGYILKSQGLTALRMFGEAQLTLDSGLQVNEDNLKLILAKALVWVQEGQIQTASQYLWEQEQDGLVIDPDVKQRILQPQN